MENKLIKKEFQNSYEKDIRKDQEISLNYEIFFLDEDPYGYSSRSKYKVRNKHIISVLKEYLPNCKNEIIDIGSGTGQLMNLVGRTFPLIEITCVEPTPRAAEALRDSGCFSVIQSDLPHLSGVNGLYACATCFDTFYYMKKAEDRKLAAANIYRILKANGRFIVDDLYAYDLDPQFFRIEKTYHFDDETITTRLFFRIENRHRMLKHILEDSHRELFEKFDFYRKKKTTQFILNHRLFFKAIIVLSKPIVWANRVFIGNLTIRRLLSFVQKNPYKIYVYKKVDADKQQARL